MPAADLGFRFHSRGILHCAKLLGWLSIYNCFLSLVYFTLLIVCFRQLWIPWDGDGPLPDLALPPATAVGISILSHSSLSSLDDVSVPSSPGPNPELFPKWVRFHLQFHPIEHPITAVFNLSLVRWWYSLWTASVSACFIITRNLTLLTTYEYATAHLYTVSVC